MRAPKEWDGVDLLAIQATRDTVPISDQRSYREGVWMTPEGLMIDRGVTEHYRWHREWALSRNLEGKPLDFSTGSRAKSQRM